jgi:hypothetical protein
VQDLAEFCHAPRQPGLGDELPRPDLCEDLVLQHDLAATSGEADDEVDQLRP